MMPPSRTAWLGPLLLFLLVFVPGGPAGGADEPDPEKLAEERKREEKCLECHDDPALAGGGRDGTLKSLHVDPQKYRASLHYAENCTCFTCHPDTPLTYHRREGVTIRSCGDCHDHEEQAKEFAASLHGRSLARGDRDAADCQDCHGNHYIRKKDDPAFAMNAENCAARCGRCHAGQAACRDFSCAYGFGRFSGHGKQDLSEDYSAGPCVLCHYGDHTHARPEPEPLCGSCHRAHFGAEEPVGRVHGLRQGPVGLFLGLVQTGGLLLFLVVVLALGLPVGVRAASFLRRRGAPAAKAGGDGEEA